MNINEHELAQAQLGGSCAKPNVQERLATYISNPLGDPSAEEVEDHLLECRDCRELFMTMLRLRGATRRVKKARSNGHKGETDDADEPLTLVEMS